MPWIRIDENAIDHPKFVALNANTWRLWCEGLCYCQKHLTNGFIPNVALKKMRYYTAKGHSMLRSVLIPGKGPLWHEVADGVQVNDYLDWNESREHVLRVRELGRQRVRRLRGKEREADSNAVTGQHVTQSVTRMYSGGVECSENTTQDSKPREGGAGETSTPVAMRPRAMQGSGVMAGSLPRDHLRHAWCGERICVPDFLHARFVRAIGGEDADERLRACYAEAMADIPPEDPIEPDPLKFWPPLVTSRWPAPQAAKTTTALTRASLGFLRGLRT